MGSPERNSSRSNWLGPVWIMVNYFVCDLLPEISTTEN